MTVHSVHRTRAPRGQEAWTEQHVVWVALLAVAVLLAVGVAVGAGIVWMLVTLWDHSGLPGVGLGGSA